MRESVIMCTSVQRTCPLVTGYGKQVLAAFDSDKNPQESVPFDQSQERDSMYALNAYSLPRM